MENPIIMVYDILRKFQATKELPFELWENGADVAIAALNLIQKKTGLTMGRLLHIDRGQYVADDELSKHCSKIEKGLNRIQWFLSFEEKGVKEDWCGYKVNAEIKKRLMEERCGKHSD